MINKIFKRKERNVIVTGPQRSGTRFTSYLIGEHTDRKFYEEDAFSVRSLELFADLLDRPEQKVIQAPGLIHCIHEIELEDACIVFMRRNIEDIKASQIRHGMRKHHRNQSWLWEGYKKRWKRVDKYDSMVDVVYKHWPRQKKIIGARRCIELEYESLKGFKEFESDRARWGARRYR